MKAQVEGVPVGYVDAYYEFTDYPAIADADVILPIAIRIGKVVPRILALYMKQMYQKQRMQDVVKSV